jgi:site-specific recombinase XerD
MGSKSKTKNSFVFDLLKNEEFPEEDLSVLSEGQYLRINKTSIVYNRNLKNLQSILDLTVPMKSHLPRTSFTNIMMEEGFNTRDISLILGHSSLSVTDNYVKSGFRNKRTDDIIMKMENGEKE